MEWKDVASFVGHIAPEAGLLLGGPVGAGVGGLLAAALGVNNTPDAVASAVQADPDAAVKIQQMLSDERVKIQQMQIAYATTALTQANATLQAQVQVNSVEAANPSMFIGGWRPAVGWVCAAALAYQYLVRPIAPWLAAAIGHPLPAMPGLDGSLWELLTGMLGIGGLRTYEKLKGVDTTDVGK